jgi:spoIIIJ-associated protein
MSSEPIEDLTEDDAVEPAREAGSGGSDRPASNTVSRLEEEGEVAADYLEELLDIADIDGDIDIEIRNGRTYISVVSDEEDNRALSALVGPDGEVLEALQELARLAVLTSTDNRSRLVLDITGYRAARTLELKTIATEAAKQVRETGEALALEPMSAYERKIVHDAVADGGLISESEGEGAGRHIVVSLPAE